MEDQQTPGYEKTKANRPARERAWKDIIRPILDKHKLYFHYDSSKEAPFTKIKVIEMERFCIAICNQRGFKDIFEVVGKLLHGLGDPKAVNLFDSVMRKLIDERKLPHFLEALAEDRKCYPERWPEVSDQQQDRKRRYHKGYEECRRIARQLWKDDPTLKKVDIIRSEEMGPLYNELSGKLKNPERTMGEWIKDLNPNYKGKQKQ
jgi:hypothetical protein